MSVEKHNYLVSPSRRPWHSLGEIFVLAAIATYGAIFLDSSLLARISNYLLRLF
jgi:hypothetical protein